MIRILIVVCAALALTALYSTNNAKRLSAELAGAVRALDAQIDWGETLSNQMAVERELAASLSDDLEALANVKDNETCRSPAIDAAFDSVRKRRARSTD